MWSLAALERLWTNDVSDTVTGKQNRASQLLLRVACDIAADHGKTHAEAQPLEETKPESNETWPFAVWWQTDQHSRSNNTDRVCSDHGEATRIRHIGTQDTAQNE